MISLEKYRGQGSRYTCPSCNGKREFTRYIDEDGTYIGDNVGKCNRDSKCGYHYPPKQFYADNPTENRRRGRINSAQMILVKQKVVSTQPDTDFIEKSLLVSTLTDYERNNLVRYLFDLFSSDTDAVRNAVRNYFIGTSSKGLTIFWQIDKTSKIRTGKIIAYDKSTGKRIKSVHPSWVHTSQKKDFQLEQCLFGEHLLGQDTHKTIAIVEAEKTAVIASILIPDMIWLAVGGKTQLNTDKLERLGTRRIILYPDADAFERWSNVADNAQKRGLSVKVSELIQSKSTEAEKADGYDIADYLIEQQMHKTSG